MTGFAAMHLRKWKWIILGLFGIEPGKPAPTDKPGEVFIPQLGRVVRITKVSVRVFALPAGSYRLMRRIDRLEMEARMEKPYPAGYVLPWISDVETAQITAIGLCAPSGRDAQPNEVFAVRFNDHAYTHGDAAAALGGWIPLLAGVPLNPAANGAEYCWDIEVIAPAGMLAKFRLDVITPVGV